jgi:hypothetical protein
MVSSLNNFLPSTDYEKINLEIKISNYKHQITNKSQTTIPKVQNCKKAYPGKSAI